MRIPYNTERLNGQPLGLYQRYKVTKAHPNLDGEDDPNAVYFVLRLDAGGNDVSHVRACQRAALEYAKLIRPHIPQLADDVLRLVATCAAETELKDVMNSAYWRQAQESKKA